MSKLGFRYGVPEHRARQMDEVYEGALRIIEKHAHADRVQQKQVHKVLEAVRQEKPQPPRKIIKLRKRT